MGIRAKLLILLLLIALLPLLVVSRLQRSASVRLGERLAAQVRQTLAEDATLQLRQLVNDSGLLLRYDRQTIERALRTQAREVENRLAGELPAHPPRVFFAGDFDSATGQVPDLVPSPKHFLAPGNTRATPMPVTYAEQVFKLAPGVEPEAVADDISRLTGMVPTYRFLTNEHPDLLYWNYTSLESGVHSSYPGHGGYPGHYDPRQRPWYRQAMESDGVAWTGPMADASSQRLIMTAALRVAGPDGRPAGVTAIDIPLSDLLSRIELPAEWAPDSNILLVRIGQPPNGGDCTPYVIARQIYRSRTQRWDVSIDLTRLESNDAAKLDRTIEHMGRSESGVEEMPYQGRRSLWAYGLIHERLYLVVIAPYNLVVARAADAESYANDLTLRQLELTSIVLGAVVVIVVLLALVISNRITDPVRRLVGAAKRLAGGDLQARVEVSNRDELGEMGRAFNTMVPQLVDNVRMRHALTLATEVQRDLLPHNAPQQPGLDVDGGSIFCDETGGDYYDFLDLSALGLHRLGIAVGDVTGHGVPAALLMATVRALLRSHAVQPGNLGRILADINVHMTSDTAVGQFTTLFYAVVDGKQRTIRWANAGHDPAILYDPETDTFDELGGAGIPLGIEADYTYTESRRYNLKPGQVIIIGTDGIWESRNSDRRPFGKDALRDFIRQHAHQSATQIVAAMSERLAEYRGQTPQEDDATLVVIRIE
ncbi:MAG: SpoIIE family protein phosphatase [Verrucomicrobia bacterium]|nr:SpoIIE family protein phosphatase [Verrucomicrobiota bacterium]